MLKFTRTALLSLLLQSTRSIRWGNIKTLGQGAGETAQSESTCCTSIKGPESDLQNPSKKIGTFAIPAQGR